MTLPSCALGIPLTDTKLEILCDAMLMREVLLFDFKIAQGANDPDFAE